MSNDSNTRATRSIRLPTLWQVMAICLVALIVATYWNGTKAPFIYDDISGILENPTIRRLDRLSDVLSPPRDSGVTVNGRPVVNLSLAVNYAMSRESVRGYHLTNIGIHAAAALVLFGLIRRTLLLKAVYGAVRDPYITPAAFLAAAVWALHPIQTESVTYVIQRAESLVGLWYLILLYGLVRAETSVRPAAWLAVAAASSFLGMATKEVMVTAPVVAFAFDSLFLSKGIVNAWKRHKAFYLVLGLSWVLLAVLVSSTSGRGGTAGFGTAMSPWRYALVQCWAVPHYFLQTLFPRTVVFDYGYGRNIFDYVTWPKIILGATMLAGVLTLLVAYARRAPRVVFVGVTYFIVLSPSSSIVPVLTEPMAEHRVYLAIAAPLTLLVIALVQLAGRAALISLALAVPIMAGLTASRNRDYRSDAALWLDTLTKVPTNARAHNNYATTLQKTGQINEAQRHLETALRQLPDFIDARANYGSVLVKQGRVAEGIAELEKSVAADPTRAQPLSSLGSAYHAAGHFTRAEEMYRRAITRNPYFAEPYNNLGVLLLDMGNVDAAMQQFETACELRHDYADAYYNLGNAYEKKGDGTRANEFYRKALSLDPEHSEALNNLAASHIRSGENAAAIALLKRAVAANPTNAEALNSLGVALLNQGQIGEAISRFQASLRLKPSEATANNLQIALKMQEQQRSRAGAQP